jgi:hypothetical protein
VDDALTSVWAAAEEIITEQEDEDAIENAGEDEPEDD